MAFSRFTLGLTIVFGGITTLTLVEAPSKTLNPLVSQTTLGRSLASVAGPATQAAVQGVRQVATLAVGCDEEKLKVNSQHVRLRGKSCQTSTHSISVKNSTNGYSATVFSQEGSGFTTDYLAMAPGENQIVIEEVATTGEKKSHTVVIQRE